MMEYNPKNRFYSGDEKFRKSSRMSERDRKQKQRNNEKRLKKNTMRDSASNKSICELSVSSIISAENSGRLGVTIEHLLDHQNSICNYISKGGKNSTVNCKVCNLITTKMCDKCGAPLCPMMKQGKLKSCFGDYHHLHYFGLACSM